MTRRIAILLLVSLALAFVSAVYHRNRLSAAAEPVPRMSLDDAKRRHVLWVDARSASDFAKGHVPNAISLPPEKWDGCLGAFIERWEPGLDVVVYCDGGACDRSQQVARRLRTEVGIKDIFVLDGPWQTLVPKGRP